MLSNVSLTDGIIIASIPSIFNLISNFFISHWLNNSIKKLDKNIKEIDINSSKLELYNKLQANLEFKIIGTRIDFRVSLKGDNDKISQQLCQFYEQVQNDEELIFNSLNPEEKLISICNELSIYPHNIFMVVNIDYYVKNIGFGHHYIYKPNFYIFQGEPLQEKLVEVKNINNTDIGILLPNQECCGVITVKYGDLPKVNNIPIENMRFKSSLKVEPSLKMLSFVYGSEVNLDSIKNEFSYIYTVEDKL